MKTQLVCHLSTRTTKETRTAFIKKIRAEYNVSYSVALRQMIEAFVEGRLTVKPVKKEFLK